MKSFKIFTVILLILSSLILTACDNGSESVICINCVDVDKDGKCDKCGEKFWDASKYATTRSTEGRDIKYVEICFEDYGSCTVLLDATTAPITVANFVSLVEKGFYDGLTMHRIMNNFMIQGGDPDGNGTGGNTDENGKKLEIKGEFDLNGHHNDISHIKGVISMARSTPYDSASSQFFICNADARVSLDGKYAAFGYVVDGLSVIDDITEQVYRKATDDNGTIKKADQPIIKYIKLLENYTHA